MNNDFIITNINRVALVDKYEYPEKITHFTHELYYNELIFHFSGKSTVYFGDKILDCSANTIRFLPKGPTIRYDVDREEHGMCIFVTFGTNKIISSEAFTINNQFTHKIGPLFKKMFSVWVAKNEGYYFECISLLYKIFAELQKQNYIPETQYNAIKPAIDYINENFLNNKISIEYLANLCGISESYLKKLFIKKFGVPPVKYIIGFKTNFACDLLRSELYSVTQVSEICGYSNVYFFSRQFKNYVGITPLEFQKKYKSSK